MSFPALAYFSLTSIKVLSVLVISLDDNTIAVKVLGNYWFAASVGNCFLDLRTEIIWVWGVKFILVRGAYET